MLPGLAPLVGRIDVSTRAIFLGAGVDSSLSNNPSFGTFVVPATGLLVCLTFGYRYGQNTSLSAIKFDGASITLNGNWQGGSYFPHGIASSVVSTGPHTVTATYTGGVYGCVALYLFVNNTSNTVRATVNNSWNGGASTRPLSMNMLVKSASAYCTINRNSGSTTSWTGAIKDDELLAGDAKFSCAHYATATAETPHVATPAFSGAGENEGCGITFA